MKVKSITCLLAIIILFLLSFQPGILEAQPLNENPELDKKVQDFLDKHRYKWHDMNISPEDGKILYDLIITNKYKNVVEIGTSTGHSAIWMAWALSKTGGKLITIEINQTRYEKALANFINAGLSEVIDARLDDAHKLVPKLEGPIDFVFCDADKGWYKNYFTAISSEIRNGGCFVAYNISQDEYNGSEVKKFLDYLKENKRYETTINKSSPSGMSVSVKKEGR